MICIDTMVVIWGVQRNRNATMVDRTRRYLSYLEQQNERVMVSSTSVAEYLYGIPLAEQANELAVLSDMFFVPPFDLHAASIAGSISGSQEYQQRFGAAKKRERNVLRADLHILSTAIAYGASAIVTDNVADFEPFAGGRIRVMEVPNIPEQGKLNLTP